MFACFCQDLKSVSLGSTQEYYPKVIAQFAHAHPILTLARNWSVIYRNTHANELLLTSYAKQYGNSGPQCISTAWLAVKSYVYSNEKVVRLRKRAMRSRQCPTRRRCGRVMHFAKFRRLRSIARTESWGRHVPLHSQNTNRAANPEGLAKKTKP